MRAMILAAGRGARMRPLTDTLPKPLLPVAGKPLIVWHLERLAASGARDVVINHAWLGQHIEAALGDGARYGLRLHYSPEAVALETAGGIARALPLLGDAPFLVINADIWCDWDPAQAADWAATLARTNALAALLMVDNPAHRPDGDFQPLHTGAPPWFHLAEPGPGTGRVGSTLTFAGIGVYQPALFRGLAPQQPRPLAPVLRQAMAHARVLGQHHGGDWVDVGTPARLRALDARLARAAQAGYTLG